MSAQGQHLSSREILIGSLTQSANEFSRKNARNDFLRVKVPSFRTDLGFPGATGVINLPEPVHEEKDPILSVVQRVPSWTLKKN